ncbi:hypothetical protein [Salinarimonas sp.]|uniref:hypothetical protein n=1 Tax=Salinarimonas sp. TaxID=2766526 RepID=UPI00391B0416
MTESEMPALASLEDAARDATDDALQEAPREDALARLPVALAQPAAPPAPETAALLAAIERLEIVLDTETQALASLSLPELKELNRRKSLCLLELTRAARAYGEDAARAGMRPRLERLRATIARNQAVLETHLDAVRDIAQTIATSLEARDSDGTYSLAPGHGSL